MTGIRSRETLRFDPGRSSPRSFSHHVWEFANTENLHVSGDYYRPIFNLVLLVNYQLFGLEVLGWHMVSVLFHLAATALIYRLGLLWGLEKKVAAIAALLFGLHPIHVEAFAGRPPARSHAGLFVLGCLVSYEKSRPSQVFSGWYFAGSVVCALLAVGTKETGIVLPLFLMVREAFDQGATGEASAKLKRTVIRIGAFAAVVFAYLSARYAVLGFITKTNVLAEKHSVGDLIFDHSFYRHSVPQDAPGAASSWPTSTTTSSFHRLPMFVSGARQSS